MSARSKPFCDLKETTVILVFGGNGFVGQHLAQTLLDRGEAVVVTTHSRHSIPKLLAEGVACGRASALSLDVTDSFAVVEAVTRLKPRVIVDLTGYHPKALSPGRDVAFRTSALLNILESARLAETSRVVLMSSMDVYWGLPTSDAPFVETAPVPLLESDDHFIVQSWVKKSLEVIANLYRRQHGMDIALVRASGIYGPLYRTYLNVPSRLIREAVEGQGELPGTGGGPYAGSGYDQLYVKDMARGIAAVVLADTLSHAAYNIGSGRAIPYREFVDAMRAIRPDFALTLPDRPAGIAPDAMDGRFLDISRASSELGFTPRYTVEAAMADYLAWVQDHGL